MELIGAWDAAEASLVKNAKPDYSEFKYDNSTNGGILDAVSKYYQVLKTVENSSNAVITNLRRVKELYNSFDDVLSTIDSICSNLTNNVSGFKNSNENILRNIEASVKYAMEKDASYGEDLEMLNQIMTEEGITPIPSQTNASTETQVPESNSPSAETSTASYTVASGDTLSKIAKQYGTTVAAIAAANGITDVNKLGVGQQLVIPSGTANASAPEQPTSSAPDVEELIKNSEDTNAMRMDNGPTNSSIGKYHDNEAMGFVVTTGNQTYQNMSSSDKELLTAIICAECDGSYDDALAVASVILNRTESSAWANCGSTPIKQATAPSQFVVYENNRYKQFMGSGVNPIVQEAVNDALNGVRNNNYYSFRANGSTSYSSNMITSSGNRYK